MENYIKVCFLTFDADDGLSMDNIFDDSASDSVFGEDTPEESNDQNDLFDNNEENKSADVEVDADKIFDENNPQGNVGEEDSQEEVEKPESNKTDEGSSPKSTFYSSALKALKDDGVLPDLDDDFIKTADSPEKMAEAIEKQVEARLSEADRRIKQALDYGVEPDEISYYEGIISKLSGINEETISGEDDKSMDIRRQIIYQDYINKGFSEQKAKREVEKSFNAGTDIDDAQEALESNKQFFQESYNNLINKNKEQTEELKRIRDNQINEYKKKVLENESPFGVKVDKNSRQKILDISTKPTYKAEDGRLITELQKYRSENPIDSEYYFSLFYTMTDGFKNIDKFVGQKVTQKTKSSLKDLENKLKNIPLNGDGSVDFGFGSDDDQSFFGKGLKLNI